MNRLPSPRDGLVIGAMSALLAGVALALLFVPQRVAQREGSELILALRLEPGGRIWLWNQPIAAEGLPALLQEASSRNQELRLRLMPAPQVSWADVQDLVSQLKPAGLPIELHLPSP